MKKLIAFLLILGIYMSAVSFATMTSGTSGKTMVGFNYLLWGYVNGISTVESDIDTGLNTIIAYGVNVTSEVIAAPLQVRSSSGTLSITSTAEGKNGLWWVIGR